MSSFLAGKLDALDIPISTGWLIGSCMEAKGKQDLWVRQKPEVLHALRDQAIIQSVESSNRIEGVTVEAARLRPLVLGHMKPQDRQEEEIVGYRKALEWIFTGKAPAPVIPDTILRLHALAQGGTSNGAGRWKIKDNEIVEIMPSGERSVRFRPTSAKATPEAVEDLCSAYADALESLVLPTLLLIATVALDFLCIHPFRDGNGRVSRLLTTLLLEQHGFIVARYISPERLVEENREDYYSSLYASSQGWHEGKHDLVPWWNYLLSILKRAYGEFSEAVESAALGAGKSEIVRRVIDELEGPFALSELTARCPSISVQLVKKVLQDMKASGELHLKGRGRGARWEKTITV